jgi:hypothetical protein
LWGVVATVINKPVAVTDCCGSAPAAWFVRKLKMTEKGSVK